MKSEIISRPNKTLGVESIMPGRVRRRMGKTINRTLSRMALWALRAKCLELGRVFVGKLSVVEKYCNSCSPEIAEPHWHFWTTVDTVYVGRRRCRSTRIKHRYLVAQLLGTTLTYEHIKVAVERLSPTEPPLDH